MSSLEIYRFLEEAARLNQHAVLVTLVSAVGSSMRNPGAQIAVRADGQFVGSVSGGCVETGIVAEALDTMRSQRARLVRFGHGSPYIDLRLPCGGGLDMHFQPWADTAITSQILASLAGRQPFSLTLHLDGRPPEFSDRWRSVRWDAQAGITALGFWPAPRIMIIGHGGAVSALANLGRSFGADMAVRTSDSRLAEMLKAQEFDVAVLKTPSDIASIRSDPWTAFAFLFHDHDWEGALMKHALSQPHFYLGAMGGARANHARQELLRDAGVAETVIKRIAAPIGIFHSSRDPETLALSTLAQIIHCYHAHDFAAATGVETAAHPVAAV